MAFLLRSNIIAPYGGNNKKLFLLNKSLTTLIKSDIYIKNLKHGDIKMPDENNFWIVEKFDGAIFGQRNGEQRQETVAGPFDTYDEAIKIKMREYKPFGCYYYTIIKSETRPERSRNSYSFDDPNEFSDDGSDWEVGKPFYDGL